MKHLLTAAVVVASFLAAPLSAQNATSGSASAANNTANQVTASGAIAAGGSVTNNFPVAPDKITTKSSGAIKNTPGLGGLALGGGHPCASSGLGIQGVMPGAGLGIGGQQIDDNCMLLIAAASSGDARYYQAFNVLTASQDMDTCNAMVAAGFDMVCLTKAEARRRNTASQLPTVSSRSAPATALNVECRNVNGRITPVVSRKVMDTYGKAAVMNACR